MIDILKPVTDTINNVIDKFVPDKAQSIHLKRELIHEISNATQKDIQEQVKVIVAEAQGKSWLQRNWRPILMMSVVSVIINNFILAPYLDAIGLPVQTLVIPDRLYSLMEIGVGGYVVGRSAEKITQIWKGKNG